MFRIARVGLVSLLSIGVTVWPCLGQEASEDRSQHAHGEHGHQGHGHQEHGHQGHGHDQEPTMPRPSVEGQELARLKKEIPPPSEQNLNFEDGPNAAPWILGGRGYSLELDTEVAQSGQRSLRIRYEEAGRFAVATLPFDAKSALGKRLRLTGYLKTEDVAQGHAGLWMRVDQGSRMVAFDNMDRRGVSGTSPWTRYTVELDVPDGATRIFYGALLTGIGTVWVDNLAIASETVPPVKSVEVSGKVMGSDGQSLGGIHLALSPTHPSGRHIASPSRAESFWSTTDDSGSFIFDQVPEGRYQLTATSPDGYAILEDVEVKEGAPLAIPKLASDSVDLSGRLVDSDGQPVAGMALEVSVGTDAGVHVFAALTDKDGQYRAQVPSHDWAHARWEEPSSMAIGRAPSSADGSSSKMSLQAIRKGMPMRGTIADFTAGSLVLASTNPNQPIGDLEDVVEIVGDARVVALGESSPGTHELFELKHRLVHLLVGELQFTALALPLGAELGGKIQDYVQEGTGETREVLASSPWWWQSREAVEFLESLRELSRPERPLRIIGYSPEKPPAEQAAVLLRELEASPQSKLVIWADNRSTARTPIWTESIGAQLAEKLGDQYLAMGGFFSQGAFLAETRPAGSADTSKPPERVWLVPPDKEFLDYLFGQMGGKLGIHDLRNFEPDGEVERWLSAPRPIRDLGPVYQGEKSGETSIRLTRAFDALFFVESTTCLEPLG